MPDSTQAALDALNALNAEFLSGADLVRLIALNAALEAPRIGEDGEAFAVTAETSNQMVNRALASSEAAARLLRDTIGNCTLPRRRQ